MRCEGCILDPLQSKQVVKLTVQDRDIKEEAEKRLGFKVSCLYGCGTSVFGSPYLLHNKGSFMQVAI